jgi:hypothetical protein
MNHRSGILGAFAFTLLTMVTVLGIAAPAGALARDEVLDRARVWVDKKVPYSQSRYATVAGELVPDTGSAAVQATKGYRTDCSGFVSMSLGFRSSSGALYSADTAGLGKLLVRIDKSDLRPGDVILRPKDLRIDGKLVPYGHAVIFGGWVDSGKTEYWGLHQSSSAKAAVLGRIRWGTSGFWSEKGFGPYRFAGVRDRVRAPRTFR